MSPDPLLTSRVWAQVMLTILQYHAPAITTNDARFRLVQTLSLHVYLFDITTGTTASTGGQNNQLLNCS